MTMISSINVTSPTTVTLNLANYGADGTLDIQLSPRKDFQFCVCPIYSFLRAAAINVAGLNQRCTYWARARNRSAAGVVEDWSPVTAFRTTDGAAQVTAPAAVMIEPAFMVIPQRQVSVDGYTTLAGYPAENLFRDSPVAWRAASNGGGGIYYLFWESSGEPFDTIALLNANLSEGSNWRLSGGATKIEAGNGVGTYNGPQLDFRASPNLPGRRGYHGLMQMTRPSLPTEKWWLMTINGTCPADTIHIEHMVFGLNRKSKNHAVEKTETPASQTTVDRKRSGMVDRVFGMPMRKVDFELQMLTEAQYETIYGDLWTRENDPVFVVPNSKSGAFFHDRFLYGDLGGGRIVNATSPRYTRSFTVSSII